MSLDPDSFRAILGRFATGVTIITCTDAQGNDAGMTVSAFSSVSLHPPLVLACIAHTASIYDALITAPAFAINILSSTQEALARRFADPDEQRFNGVGFTRGQEGSPGGVSGPAILNGVLAAMECRRVVQYESGDHTIIVGEVQRAIVNEGKPLLYYRGGFAQVER